MPSGRRIAIIEDDEIMGASLVQRLELEGARPIWWTRGGEAVAALVKAPGTFDAVVCDIRLPDGSGEACSAGSPLPRRRRPSCSSPPMATSTRRCGSCARIDTLGPGFFLRSHENAAHVWADVFFGPNRDAMQVIDKETLEEVERLPMQAVR